MKYFGPMCIDFDEYHPYSGSLSENVGIYIMLIFGVIMATLFQKPKATC